MSEKTDENERLQLFEDQPIRTAWDEVEEDWYFSVVDVVGALTDQPDARHASTYWAVMKTRLKEEGAAPSKHWRRKPVSRSLLLRMRIS